ncbi:hypothetical protein MNBD_BACTEROID06-1117 [hydrothermal vent metagenome]|uniref:Uncharacterized protein n=1 Tax=hydrothermal vent metagenome TaxID=652676 RepID=A0A3B0UMD7_9ZZZZ
MQPNLLDIPQAFYPFESNEPFKECMVCGIDLTLGTTDYFVEKAVKNNVEYQVQDIVFEYAICSACAQNMQQSISKESMENMQAFFTNHQTFMSKIQAYQQGKGEELDIIISTCTLYEQPIEQLSEYMMFGHFRGDKMIATTMPYIMGGKAMDELSELMSNETIDEMNRFKNEYFGGPAELEDLWKGKPVFL